MFQWSETSYCFPGTTHLSAGRLDVQSVDSLITDSWGHDDRQSQDWSGSSHSSVCNQRSLMTRVRTYQRSSQWSHWGRGETLGFRNRTPITVHEFSCPSFRVITVLFLLVWYNVWVFVCENTFQGHSLNLLVLMAEQLKTHTERNTSHSTLHTVHCNGLNCWILHKCMCVYVNRWAVFGLPGYRAHWDWPPGRENEGWWIWQKLSNG